jgi:hypothetical protein
LQEKVRAAEEKIERGPARQGDGEACPQGKMPVVNDRGVTVGCGKCFRDNCRKARRILLKDHVVSPGQLAEKTNEEANRYGSCPYDATAAGKTGFAALQSKYRNEKVSACKRVILGVMHQEVGRRISGALDEMTQTVKRDPGLFKQKYEGLSNRLLALRRALEAAEGQSEDARFSQYQTLLRRAEDTSRDYEKWLETAFPCRNQSRNTCCRKLQSELYGGTTSETPHGVEKITPGMIPYAERALKRCLETGRFE